MNQLLVIHASPRGQDSISRKSSDLLIKKLKSKNPTLQVKVRDLSVEAPPHVDYALVGAFFTPPESRSAEQNEKIKLSDSLVDELFESDTILISTPMWNFSVPSALKAYIDHIVRAGRTFSFAKGYPEGLVTGKKVYVLTASGSVFSSGPFSSYDHLNSYLPQVLGFIGMTDVTVLRSEGLNDPAVQVKAYEKLQAEVEAL